jgi:hypothetical protein
MAKLREHTHDHRCLQPAAEVHVSYELRLLGSMAGAVVMPTPLADAVYTPLLESFAVHARNLIEFLTDEHTGGWQHRVIAADYFDDPPSQRWSVEPVELGELLQRMVSRKVSHIFCDRADPALDWGSPSDRERWASAIFDSFGRFLAELRATHQDRAAWFGTALADGRQLRADAGTRAWALMGQVSAEEWCLL